MADFSDTYTRASKTFRAVLTVALRRHGLHLGQNLVLTALSAWRDGLNTMASWLGVRSYPPAVLFAVGIAWILPSGRARLFLTGGPPDSVLPVIFPHVP